MTQLHEVIEILSAQINWDPSNRHDEQKVRDWVDAQSKHSAPKDSEPEDDEPEDFEPKPKTKPATASTKGK